MTDASLPKRHPARRMWDAVWGLLSGSDMVRDYHATCPVCKRLRHVRMMRFWRYPSHPRTVMFLTHQRKGATSLPRALPDFIIIGASKSGTTSLYGLITTHPDVLPALVKEVNYFNYPGNYRMGMQWYRSHFPSIPHKHYLSRLHGRRVLSGEASASYMFHPMVPGRVRAELPDVRLIAILRNPVDRAYSQYNMQLRLRRESLTFEDAVAAEDDRMQYEMKKFALKIQGYNKGWWNYLGKGRYAEQLARWLEHFDRDRLLVLTTEELEADQRGVLDRIFEFLGLEPFDAGAIPPSSLRDTAWMREKLEDGRPVASDSWRLNVGGYPQMGPDTRRMLVDYFRPHNERLSALLGRSFDWDR